jgi:putative flavoprotein involved in K+ transport
MKATETGAKIEGEPIIEAGEALRRLGGLAMAPKRQRTDVIVVGGGQAGLSVGYHLRASGLGFVILDAAERIGDAWRNRWDSLRLFTPAKLDGLDGWPFPAPPNSFPTKDEMADYLEAYAKRFELPVRTRARVERLFRRDGVYVARTGDTEIEADQVVIAMSNYQQARVPGFANQLRADIVQVHAGRYRNPRQLRDGAVLIVGAGNSGAEIAMELGRDRRIWMAGPSTGEVPFRNDGRAARWFLTRLLLRFVFHRVLTIETPMGRKARPKIISRGTPLIRTKAKNLAAAGIERAPRITGVRDGLPVTADGRVLDVANVVWCGGFDAGLSWIDLPDLSIIGADGEPIHEGGVVPGAPGLYFVGLHFLYSMSSSMIHGVGRDARRIARAVAACALVSSRRGNTQAHPAGDGARAQA